MFFVLLWNHVTLFALYYSLAIIKLGLFYLNIIKIIIEQMDGRINKVIVTIQWKLCVHLLNNSAFCIHIFKVSYDTQNKERLFS